MASSGGVCWVHLKNRKRFEFHTQWIAQDFAIGRGLDKADEDDVGYLPAVVMCAYGDNIYGIELEEFVDFIDGLTLTSHTDPCTSTYHWWQENEVNLFNLTFREFIDYLFNHELRSGSWGFEYEWFWNPIKRGSLKVPEHLMCLTLREWGHLVASTIDIHSYCERETWDSKGTYDKDEEW